MEYASLSNITKKNQKSIILDYGSIIKNLTSCIEKQNNLIMDYSLHVNFNYKEDYYPALRGIVYKNSLNLHSALQLIKLGYHSSAAILLRNVFEGFIIIIQVIKYDDKKLYKEFYEADFNVKPVSKILNNKKIPNDVKDEIIALWRYLCKKSHSTIYSMQVGLDYNQMSKDGELVNKNLIDFMLGLLTLFVDINWILSRQYIFDMNCHYIACEGHKRENKYTQYIYKYNVVEKLYKKYRKSYTKSSEVFINFLEKE
ncbi:MAG: hypothetical protein IJE53_03740 [Bacilli bacterium]|nr:hypothetical protein [Bacilli bacterium]